MKIIEGIEQNTPKWEEWRKGKLGGSKDVISKRGDVKMATYQLIADRLAVPHDGQDYRERGHELEDAAAEEWGKKHGWEIVRGIVCVSDDDDRLALSPDVFKKPDEDGLYKIGAEIKCLASANHIKAYIESRGGKIPSDFKDQYIHYFIVDDELEELYSVFHDPRIPTLSWFEIKIKRSWLEDEIIAHKEAKLKVLRFVDEWVDKIGF